MDKSTTFIMFFRHSFLALCVFACVVGFAAPASAGPLCSELENILDEGFDENLDESTGNTGDATDLNGDDRVCRDFAAGVGVSAYYLFDTAPDGSQGEFEHLLRVGFDQVVNPFGLAFELVYHPEGTDFGIEGFNCLPYASGPGGPCVEYRSLNEVDSADYEGLVYWLIAWTPEMGTEAGRIIHAPGDTNDYAILTENLFFDPAGSPRDYDCDSPYFSDCGEIVLLKAPGDPARGATSDNFSNVVNMEPIPEPGTFALLGIVVGGYVLNRRRRE
jgi:hypothetical protein